MYPVLHDSLGKSILKSHPQTGPEMQSSGARALAAGLLLIATIAIAGDYLAAGIEASRLQAAAHHPAEMDRQP